MVKAATISLNQNIYYMIDLTRYFKIQFVTLEVSRERLKNFTIDHIQRLTSSNPGGIFTSILTDITTVYTAYYGDIEDEDLAQAVLQSYTLGLDDSRKALVDFISRAEGIISFTWGKTSMEYEQFYPHGVSEYSQSTLPELQTYSQRFVSVATTYSASLPASFVSDVTTLRNTFINNRNAQLGQKGTVADERSQLTGTRSALCLQLTKNLLTIALHYLGDETKATVYFDQSLIDRKQNDTDTLTETLAPEELKNIAGPDSELNTVTELKVVNNGPEDLLIGFAATATEKPTIPPAINLPSGATWQNTPATLGYVQGSFDYLMLFNHSDSLSAPVTITLKY